MKVGQHRNDWGTGGTKWQYISVIILDIHVGSSLHLHLDKVLA
jgi:hypothetical protein